MRPQEFIDAVYAAVYKTVIDGIIRILVQPPGRRPRPDIVDLSIWYNGLNEGQQNHVQEVVRLATDQAVFGMLAALDGVRSLGPDVRLSLNSDGTDLTAHHELHDLFRHRVDQELGYEE